MSNANAIRSVQSFRTSVYERIKNQNKNGATVTVNQLCSKDDDGVVLLPSKGHLLNLRLAGERCSGADGIWQANLKAAPDNPGNLRPNGFDHQALINRNSVEPACDEATERPSRSRSQVGVNRHWIILMRELEDFRFGDRVGAKPELLPLDEVLRVKHWANPPPFKQW